MPGVEARLGMSRPLAASEVQAIWQLCLAEAGLFDDTSRACTLFEPEEVKNLGESNFA